MDIQKSIKKDLIKGKKVEKILLDKLNNLYNNEFRACDNQYHLFDMVNKSNNIYVELKSRGNKINTYETSIVGTNKIKKSTCDAARKTIKKVELCEKSKIITALLRIWDIKKKEFFNVMSNM